VRLRLGVTRRWSMSAERKEDAARRNPCTVDEARAFVKHVESLFMPWDVEGIVAGFTDDCVVCFGDVPEFQGKAELTRFFRARSARQKGYRLRKELRALMGDVLANYWEGDWEDAQTGAQMVGRGVEIWVMRDGKIARWEAAFNVHEAGKAGGRGIL
jgi:nuclear transport factor 2 (NTF2) superfamily protein